MEISNNTLTCVLSKMLCQNVTQANYQVGQMKGDSKGKLRLITGTAETKNGEKLPYKVILKIVGKADCPVDPNTGRREYDLYKSDFGKLFTDGLRWPECFYAEMNEDESETQLWIEYIDGVSGNDLTVEMFECAAYEIGRFQGRLYAEQPLALQNIPNLSKSDIRKGYYFLDRSQKMFYDFVRSDNSGIPDHLRKMIIDMDENADDLWSRIERLPIVLSHRDVWMKNILFFDGKITLVDWDTAGWGYIGEDIITLIADTDKVDNIMLYYKKCFPAYHKGFTEYVNFSHIPNFLYYERLVYYYGYRFIAEYMYANTPERKELKLQKLRKLYEMKDM